MPYEHIDHSADIGVRVRGGSLQELFENAAAALFDVMTDSSVVQPRLERGFACSRDTSEELLVEWLGELLYVFESEHIVFVSFSVRMADATTLVGHAAGELFDPARHAITHLVKAITYHGLSIRQGSEGWETTVIFDV